MVLSEFLYYLETINRSPKQCRGC